MAFENLSIKEVTADSVTITWDASSSFVPSNVIMTVSNDGSHISTGVDPSLTTATVLNLESKKSYSVSLKAIVDNFWFDSESIYVVTK